MKRQAIFQTLIERRVPGILLFGLLAGTVNGLLGAGGGILVVFAFSYALRGESIDRRDVFANALCVMLPISLFSCIRYAVAGNLPSEGFAVYLLPAVLGGVVGGILLGKLRAKLTQKLFAALVIYSGLILIIR